MDLHLKGKQVLVTGSSRGIGRAVAESMLREGCVDVVLVSSDKAALERTRADLLDRHGAARIAIHAADLRSADGVESVVAAFPDIDILVNNAGAIPHGTLTSLDEAAWLEGWDLKVFGYVRLCRAYYAKMAARRTGVIINIIGYAGARPSAGYIAGGMGNAALIAMTNALGAASPADNIRVVGINPGPILTERLKKRLLVAAKGQLGDEARWAELMKPYPFGRAGHPEEVADTVAYLASDRAGYITGSIVSIDGGLTHKPPAN